MRKTGRKYACIAQNIGYLTNFAAFARERLPYCEAFMVEYCPGFAAAVPPALAPCRSVAQLAGMPRLSKGQTWKVVENDRCRRANSGNAECPLSRQVSVFTLALQSVTTAVWPEAVAGIEETRRRLRHYAGGSPRNCVWTSASSSGMCRRTTCETMVESNES